MPRGTLRLDEKNDRQDKVCSALWNAVPSLPRLPADAPDEFKKLTVDVKNPKRVYIIHQASRRHGFQLLVERYINQVRYGCGDSSCTVSTCYTFRRRIAGTRPTRRYNATSARTLACFLASQDDPEKGLCRPTGTESMKKPYQGRSFELPKISKVKDDARADPGRIASEGGAARVRMGAKVNGGSPAITANGESDPTTPEPLGGSGSLSPHAGESNRLRSHNVQGLDHPVKKDHKSFLQNLFGTVTFRMLEWLTPSSLESLISPESDDRHLREGVGIWNTSTALSRSSLHSSTARAAPHGGANGVVINGDSSEHVRELPQTAAVVSNGTPQSTVDGNPRLMSNKTTVEEAQKQALKLGSSRRSCSTNHVGSDCDTEVTSRCANGSTDTEPKDIAAITGYHSIASSRHGHDITKQKGTEKQAVFTKQSRSRTASIIAPSIRVDASTIKSPTVSLRNVNHGFEPRRQHGSPEKSGDLPGSTDKQFPPNGIRTPNPTNATEVAYTTRQRDAAQSLSVIPPRIISSFAKYFCDIQDVPFQALYVPDHLRKRLQSYTSNQNNNIQWQLFLHQSLFYVLSSPESLLKSFEVGDSDAIVHPHIIWDGMQQIIRISKPIALDSLWIAAAALYEHPHELWSTYDWPEKSGWRRNVSRKEYTNAQMANLVAILFCGLVALLPSGFSREEIESVITSRSRGWSGHDTRRCALSLDDAFSNELALRFARRLFAAIPAGRLYQEILKVNVSGDGHKPQTPDILNTALDTLTRFDPGLHTKSAMYLDKDVSMDENVHLRKHFVILLLEWARTLLLKEWNGQAEVPSNGAFGGALALLSALYQRRKELAVTDDFFTTEYFADRLDSVQLPVQWLSFTASRSQTHLLEYPFLFSADTLVTYFRAVNFSRMSQSFEASNSMHARINSTAAPFIRDLNRHHELLERLKTSHTRYLALKIRRDHVLKDAFDCLWRREERELLRPLKVRLGEDSGEQGTDSGGVQQEFFRLAIAEAFNPDCGIFTVDEGSKMAWFLPGSPEPLWKYELIGVLVSLAVYNGVTLPITFPKALYRKLRDIPNAELHHIEDGWPELASGLTTLLDWDEKDGLVSDIFSRTYEFSIDLFGRQVSQDMVKVKWMQLWPQFYDPPVSVLNPTEVPLVDAQNRKEYVADYIHWLTDVSVKPQFEAFQKGFMSCLEPRSIQLLSPDLLQSVVEGVQEIDIQELRMHTQYQQFSADDRIIRDFWSIVKKFNNEEKKKLLEFVTASDRLPVGGPQNLQFRIQKNGDSECDDRLPTSYTCFGTLLLPEYSNKETLRVRLMMALENAKGFGFA